MLAIVETTAARPLAGRRRATLVPAFPQPVRDFTLEVTLLRYPDQPASVQGISLGTPLQLLLEENIYGSPYNETGRFRSQTNGARRIAVPAPAANLRGW